MRKKITYLLAIAAALALLLASVVHVAEGSLAILSWRGGGTPALLKPGFTLRFPFLQRLERYPEGRIDLSRSAPVVSRDGDQVELPFELRLKPREQDLLILHREGGAGGARAALEALAREVLEARASIIGTHELASGNSSERLELALRRSLQERLKVGVGVSIGAPRVPDEVRASFDLDAVYARRRDTDVNVLLIGIDGADWDFIDPMLERGELPHLGRLKREGIWARLRSNVPTLSPLLWTTVATGKSPDQHGINDFLVADPRSGHRVPINSTFRRAKALWNILSEARLQNDIVAWWATWPVEPIAGHLISDRVAYSTFDLRESESSSNAVFPPAYAATVDRLRLPEDAVTHAQVARFLRISEEELRQARGARRTESETTERQESINVMVRVLAATETYRRVALDLLRSRARAGDPARLTAVYFQGVDEVNHRFAHCAPPRMPLCSEADYRRFSDAVAAFYRYQDEILGELLLAAPGATVIVISDHGFSSGNGRPDDIEPFIEGKPGLWHDLVGIFLAWGPGIGTGEVTSVRLYDIAPTILRLLGFPLPEDMPGRVVEGVLSGDLMAAQPIERVRSYEGPEGLSGDGAGRRAGKLRGEVLHGGADEEIIQQLQALGYVGGAPREPGRAAGPSAGPEVFSGSGEGGAATGGPAPTETADIEAADTEEGPPPGGGVPTLLYHTNLGAVYLGQGRLGQAEAEFRRALRIDPRAPEALTGMASLFERKGEPEKALEILRHLIGLESKVNGIMAYRMAMQFIRLGRAADGVTFLERVRHSAATEERIEVGLEVALGVLYAAVDRRADAEAAMLRAIALDPVSTMAMQELFTLYDGENRAAELEPLLRDALARDERLAMHHNWLGLVLKRRGDMKGAEVAFRQTLEIAPDMIGTMANLGGLYMEQGRATDAVAILQQAVERDPRNIESRTNLIVALGMEGDPDGALRQAETATALGFMVPEFYTALGYAMHINGRREEALEAVRNALALDPRHPDTLRLQSEILNEPQAVTPAPPVPP